MAVEVVKSDRIKCSLIFLLQQGWGDGRLVLITPTVPAVAKQLAPQFKRLPRVYLLSLRLSNGNSRIGLLGQSAGLGARPKSASPTSWRNALSGQ